MAKPPFIWEAHEYLFQEKSADWYWIVGIVTLSASVLAIIFGNVLFGLILLMGGFTLSVFAARKPSVVRYEIGKTGILMDKRFFPFGTLESFWVEDNRHVDMQSKLLIKSQRIMVPLIVIPLEGISPEDLRDFLLDHLLEEHHTEPLGQKIMEGLGF